MTLSAFFVVLGLISMGGVVISLFTGLFAMSRGGDKNHQVSNKMMRARIWLQGLTLLFFILATVAR